MFSGFSRQFLASACAILLSLAVALAGSRAAIPAAAQGLSADKYVQFQPHELGRVPVLMYHNIVPADFPIDPAMEPFMYRTYEQFWNDMLWFYEHDFYLVGMNELISGNMDVPLGKHPVVFTFDDGSWRHFSFIEDEHGELIIDPNCAVGLMERFYEQYPGFGRGAHFALVPAHKFSWPEHEQDEYFDRKVQWLMENDYEIGNHTLSHPNLAAIDDEEFAWTVSGPIIWADDVMGEHHPTNATRVLTLPFGMYPAEDDVAKNRMIEEGMEWDGESVQLSGVLFINGGSSQSPWSVEWNPLAIPRVPVQEDVMNLLKEVHYAGENPYYTSDGNLDTVTIPWPLPKPKWGKLNANSIAAAGKTLVKYNPGNGHLIKTPQAWSRDDALAYRWLYA